MNIEAKIKSLETLLATLEDSKAKKNLEIATIDGDIKTVKKEMKEIQAVAKKLSDMINGTPEVAKTEEKKPEVKPDSENKNPSNPASVPTPTDSTKIPTNADIQNKLNGGVK